MTYSPPFGQADLTNCERELIHLAGSIQPHGLLLVVRLSSGIIVQASANAAVHLGLLSDAVLGRDIEDLGGDLAATVRRAAAERDLFEPLPLLCRTAAQGKPRSWEGALHRVSVDEAVIELEPVPVPATGADEQRAVLALLATATQRLSGAANLGVLADAAAQSFRELTGYDRVMVYRFDADGHGKIIAEARDGRLDSLLGHHYPATDIPQRARELYLRNRVRVLVDVHYEPSKLLGAAGQPATELDMSMCYLRSMSPLHLQYLKNMGVTGTLVVSLVREGKLWGLIAAHHYSVRNVRYAVRAACDLLAEVMATRIAAIENYAHAQVAVLVRRLEQRLIEATSTEGDWRLALFRNPRTLLQPLEATGAALFVDGEILTSGEVPSTPELRELLRWIDDQTFESPFVCSAVGKANASLDLLTPTASGVLAVRLSTARPDYLMWFRKEQLLSVTWAGDPSKPMIGNDPLELSPRRSFAAWSEIVRGTALPWTSAEIALGRAIGVALVDIIVQVHAVRLLIAEHQLAGIRNTVQSSLEPVLIANAGGEVLFCNQAFADLAGADASQLPGLDELCALFSDPAAVRRALADLRGGHAPWRGELALARSGAEPLPVALRAELVKGRDGAVLGTIVILTDLRDLKRASAARRQLERSIQQAARGRQHPGALAGERDADEVMGAILTNAGLAAMDIADGSLAGSIAPLLEELEASTRRATALYGHVRSFSEKG